MLERFTEDARAVVLPLAQQQARQWPTEERGGKPVLAAVHLLLALAAGEHGPAAEVLRTHGIGVEAIREQLRGRVSGLDADALATLGIDLAAVRAATEATFGPGALDTGSVRGRVSFGPQVKQVLVLAVQAAVRAHRNHIGTEHLLHGVLNVGDGTVGSVLAGLDVDRTALAAEVAALIGPAAA
jgi:ATP-dependent Clp protease ATP-binding subunit ClpA